MNSGESRYYKYSLLNPEDEKKLIAKWGGENVIKRKYPAVWTAIQNTKEYEHEVKECGGIYRDRWRFEGQCSRVSGQRE